jgi:Sulfatase
MTITRHRPALRNPEKPRGRVKWTDIALLGIAAAFAPLDVMANNPFDIGHPERILGLVGLLWIGGLMVVTVLVRGGVRTTTAVSSVFLVSVLLMRGGSVLSQLGEPLGWVVLGVLLAAVIFVISRIETQDALTVLLCALGAFLIAGPVTAVIREISNSGIDETFKHQGEPVTLSNRPDIFLVVLDGYAGNITLESEFGLDRSAVVHDLAELGFEVPASAWSAYPTTRSSLPSLLNMSYPLGAGSRVTPMTERSLSDMIGGSNSLTSTLSAEGYEMVMIESGWSGSRCGTEVDKCVAAPVMDEAMFSIAEKSVAGPSVLRSLGYAFTVGAQHTMTWLDEHGPQLSADSRPSFVFAHVMVPHPPFFMDESCQTRFGDEYSGVLFSRPGDDPLDRRTAYLRQTKCVDQFIAELVRKIQPDDTVVVVGDHGTDQRNQLVRDPAYWTQSDLAERFNVFLAVRDGAECSVGDSVILPNIFRRVLSCHATQDLEELEPRMFKYSGAGGPAPEVLEVDSSDVLDLLSQ